MAVRNRNQVRVDTRIQILATAIGEYAKAFGADKGCLESIRKGVFERAIIEQIEFMYYNRKKYVGHIIMKIDWRRHQVLVKSEGKNEFQLRTDKSVLQQLDLASQEIIQHVQRMKKECHVTKIEPVYQYRIEYRLDDKKHDEARKYLGHVCSTDSIQRSSSSVFKTYIRFIMDTLDELEIIVEN